MCQCIGNAYVCDTETCQKKINQIILRKLPNKVIDVGDDREDESREIIKIEEKQIVKSTVTPPANCDAEK